MTTLRAEGKRFVRSRVRVRRGEREVAGPLRHTGDLIRVVLGIVVFGVTLAVIHRGHVGTFETNIFRLVNELPSWMSLPFVIVMQAGNFFAIVVVAVAAFVTRRARLARDLAAAGAGAWFVAKLAKEVVKRARPHALLRFVTVRGALATGLGFPSGHAAVVTALVTAAGPHLSRRYRRLSWLLVAAVALARIYVGAHLPFDVVGGAAIGWVVGAAVHLIFGAPGGSPTVVGVQQALKRMGVIVKDLRLLGGDARGSTPMLARGSEGEPLFLKWKGRQHRDADWLFRAWRYLMYHQAGDEIPFATPKQLSEHEAYMSLLAARAGVRTPKMITAATLPDSSCFLLFERVQDDVLSSKNPDDIDAALLNRMWKEIARLHDARIAHRDLRAENVLIDDDDQPWIVDFGFAESSADDRLLAQDNASLMASLVVLIGVDRTLASANRSLSDEALKAAIPFLHPRALPAATKRLLRKSPESLKELREGLVEKLNLKEEPETEKGLRLRLRTLGILLVIGLAVHVIVPKAGELKQTTSSLGHGHWIWIAAAVLASAFTYLMASVELMGAAGRRLSLMRTSLAQLASTAANRITVSGIGAAGVNTRYLERSGLSTTDAVSAVAVMTAAGVVVHSLGLAATVPWLWSIGLKPKHLLPNWQILVVVLAVLTAAGVVLFVLGKRRPQLKREVAANLARLMRHPERGIPIVLGAAGLNMAYIVALWCSLHAFGAHISAFRIAAAYLASQAIASASPTPGGLGAMEAALVAALNRLGVASGPAIAGVLSFRLVTYWLPILPGVVSLHYLRRKKAL